MIPISEPTNAVRAVKFLSPFTVVPLEKLALAVLVPVAAVFELDYKDMVPAPTVVDVDWTSSSTRARHYDSRKIR